MASSWSSPLLYNWILVAYLALTAFASPHPRNNSDIGVTAINWDKVNFVQCKDAALKEKFKQGIKDALVLAAVANSPNLDFSTSNEIKDFFGKKFSDDMVGHIKRVQLWAAIFNPEGIPPTAEPKSPGVFVEVHCDDYRKGNKEGLFACADAGPGKLIAGYADNVYDAGNKLIGGKFTLCEDTLKTALSLSDRDKKLDAGSAEDRNNLDEMRSMAYYTLHELHHLDIIGVDPHIKDVQYGPARCRRLAKDMETYGPEFTSINADSYAWYAVARYYQKRYNAWPTLPLFSGPFSIEDVSDDASTTKGQAVLQPEDL